MRGKERESERERNEDLKMIQKNKVQVWYYVKSKSRCLLRVEVVFAMATTGF